MDERTCSEPDCERKPRSGRQPLCGLHYQQQWKQGKVCVIGGCDSPYLAKGMCGLHYKRNASGDDMSAPRRIALPGTPCDVEGCDRPRHAGGYCGMHFQRIKRTGDPFSFLGIVRPELCSVDDCDLPHFGLGYCGPHYKRQYRGVPLVRRTCLRCGEPFDRPVGKVGSYGYCAECQQVGFPYWAAIRRERITANNLGMTDEDDALAAEYREIIASDPCVYCGSPSTAVDHIHPVARGGSDRWMNLAPICASCNSRKCTRSVLDMLTFMEGPRGTPASGGEAAGRSIAE